MGGASCTQHPRRMRFSWGVCNFGLFWGLSAGMGWAGLLRHIFLCPEKRKLPPKHPVTELPPPTSTSRV